MTVYIEDDYDFLKCEQGLMEKVQEVIRGVLDEEHVPYEVELCISVVDKEEIAHINKEQRNIDKATDVLSFPQIEPAGNGIILWDTLDEASCMNLDTGEWLLGDIVLCHEVAKEQALAYGHSLEREVCFLVAHSMFHLLGYDHMTKEDEALMMAKQTQLLNQLGIVR